ncbi:MAG: hypothetical protein DSY42_00850 [Aquifex sp.]|nr:MAG: hypothetical protein DSY42_00850 [Aquifex sp.]
MKGFSLVSTVAATFIFTAVGFALLVMSDEGFRITKSSINHNIAEANSEYALNAGIEAFMTSNSCSSSGSGNVNGGDWEYRMYEASPGQCFILAVGRKDNAVRYKIAYVNMQGGGGGLGALTVNYMDGNYFRLVNRSRISGRENCPALAYYDCGELCDDIQREENEGQIDRTQRLTNPMDLNEVLFREGTTIEDLKNYIVEQFNTIYDNYQIPSPPDITLQSCQISGVSRCEIRWDNKQVIRCGNQEIDTSACSTVVLSGTDVTVDFWGGDIRSNLVIEGTNVQIKLGNTQVSGSIFIQALDEVSRFETNNTTNINGEVVISAGDLRQINLVNDTQINGSLIINLSNSTEETYINFSNNVNINGDLYFRGYKVKFSPSNNSTINGNFLAKADHEIEIKMTNETSINGRILAYAEEVEFEGVNRTNIGGGDNYNILIGEEEVEIELTNRSTQGNIGYVITLNDGGEMKLKLTDRTSLEGLFITDNLEADLVNNTSISGIIIAERVDEEIRIPNNARIEGLLAVLEEMEGLELVNRARIEGLILLNSLTERLRMTNRAEIVSNFDLVKNYIDMFNLSDYINALSCDTLGGSGSGTPTLPQHLIGSVF